MFSGEWIVGAESQLIEAECHLLAREDPIEINSIGTNKSKESQHYSSPRMTAAERRVRLAASTDYSNQSYMSN